MINKKILPAESQIGNEKCPKGGVNNGVKKGMDISDSESRHKNSCHNPKNFHTTP